MRIRRPRWSSAVATMCAATLLVADPAAAACTDAAAPDVDWSGCTLRFAVLSEANLAGADLRGADLSFAVMFRTDLRNADLRGASMRDSFPVGANLAGANLTGADLTDADLVGANLRGAILRDATLSSTDVDRAVLSEADFTGADLTDADFEGVSGAAAATFAVTPTAQADRATTWQGRSIDTGYLANDDRAFENTFATRSIEIVSAPQHGSFDAGTGRYQPADGFSGTDEIRYRLISRLGWDELPATVDTVYVSETVSISIDVIPTVTLGPPYAGSGGAAGEVARLYVAIFRRVPDADGHAFWVRARQDGMTLNDVATNFISSSEFLADNGSLDDGAFVTLLYRNILEREPDAAGRAYWAARLAADLDRSAVVLHFSESPEFLLLTGTS